MGSSASWDQIPKSYYILVSFYRTEKNKNKNKTKTKQTNKQTKLILHGQGSLVQIGAKCVMKNYNYTCRFLLWVMQAPLGNTAVAAASWCSFEGTQQSLWQVGLLCSCNFKRYYICSCGVLSKVLPARSDHNGAVLCKIPDQIEDFGCVELCCVNLRFFLKTFFKAFYKLLLYYM